MGVDKRPATLQRGIGAGLAAGGARLTELGAETLVPVVTVFCRRYAVEDDRGRLTLDVCVHTDRHKLLSYGVLEYKSTSRNAAPPGHLTRLGLRPLKVSKYLRATEV
jgi:hypothetical protein